MKATLALPYEEENKQKFAVSLALLSRLVARWLREMKETWEENMQKFAVSLALLALCRCPLFLEGCEILRLGRLGSSVTSWFPW